MSSYTHGTPEVWKEVFEGSDVIYSDFPETQNQLFEHTKILFLQEIFPKGNQKMLEVGCGSAFVSLFFAKKGYQATCFDINESILEVAQRNFKKEKVKGNFVVGTVEKLPFADNYFDIVSSFGLMEHFEDPLPAFREMVRVLKPGGLLFNDIVPDRFSVQTFGNFFNFVATFSYWLVKGKPGIGWQKGIRNFQPLYFESSLTWKDYKKLIEKAGIKKVEVYGNRPFPRLTLPLFLDKIYVFCLKPFLSIWKKFDRWDSLIPKFWGAGLWFWGVK